MSPAKFHNPGIRRELQIGRDELYYYLMARAATGWLLLRRDEMPRMRIPYREGSEREEYRVHGVQSGR